MSWTQDDVDTLKRAIATGAREVAYADGRRTVFRSLAEMQRILGDMQAEVTAKPRTLKDDRVATGVTSDLSRGVPVRGNGFGGCW